MRKPLTAAALLLTGALLVGCSSASPDPGSPSGTIDPDATVDIQVGLEPTSLDLTTTSGAALQQLMVGNVYEGLILKTAEGELVPGLATEWTVAEDGLSYSFTLREGVTFHDGAALTAEDVVTSLTAAGAADSQNPNAARMRGITSATVTEEGVEITLAARDVNFLDSLSGSGGAILSQGSTADLGTEANGTGPYTVTQWNRGSTLTLTRFDDYWGETPANGAVVYHYITEPTTAATALQSGEVDILAGANAETTELFSEEAGFTVNLGDSTSWMTLGMNNAEGPTSDYRVRQAIRQAIDKDALIQVIGGQALRVGTITVPTDPWHVDMVDSAAFDPDAAKALLAEAGYEELELTMIVANTYDTAITEFIAAQLAEVGITMNIETVEFATWLEQAFNGKQYELTMVLHVDPATLTFYGNPDYYFNYDNPEVAALVAEARASSTPEERDASLEQVARLVAEESVSDWLYSPQTVVISAANVTGYPTDRISTHFLVGGITVTED